MLNFYRLEEILALKDEYIKNEHFELWFRGHSNAKYNLIPSLYRLNLGENVEDYQKFELNSYDLFEDHCNKLGIKIPENSWERICFMQHYGVKTRFLDWSKEFDIALFFAFESWNPMAKEANDRIATIWILEPNTLNMLSSIPARHGLDSRILVPKKNDEDFSYKKFLTSRQSGLAGTLAVDLTDNLSEDSAPNKRIKIQQGVFTLHETKFDLMSELTFRRDYGKHHQKTYINDTLRRIDLHPELYKDVKEYLNSKGLLHSAIYPDIEGISTTVNRLSAGDKNWYEVF
ncbi:FRG domain-containing protein [Bacillus hominis]|uniref:FRG domain-containing protein n=1 Tax=Bacillus hominis TaxID=2817478 RepID=UPI003D64BA7C